MTQYFESSIIIDFFTNKIDFAQDAPAMFVYNYQKCIEILMAGGIATEEEAIEHMEFNVVGSWVGEGTPGFMVSCTMQETLDALED